MSRGAGWDTAWCGREIEEEEEEEKEKEDCSDVYKNGLRHLKVSKGWMGHCVMWAVPSM